MTRIWSRTAAKGEYTEAKIDSKGWFKAGISVFDCAPLSQPFPDVTLKVTSSHAPADFFEPGTVFTISDRLKSVLEEFEVSAEFFPLQVIYKGKPYTGRNFYFCNILDLVDCFDLKRGEYTFWDGPGQSGAVKDIGKLVINEKKAAGHDMFRIANGGGYIVCVSDRVADRIVEEKLTGVRFIKPEKWSFGALSD